jgi:hypothetical protein
MSELSRKSNLKSFYLQDGIDAREAWVIILALGLFALAAVGGGGLGWLLSYWTDKPHLSTAYMAVGGSIGGLFIGWKVLALLVEAAAPVYEAQMNVAPKSTGKSFPRDVSNPGRRIVLTENDKRILQVFAGRYPVIKTLAVNEWEGDTSPLQFDFISKRDAIRRVQRIVIGLGYGTRDGRGGVNIIDINTFLGRVIPQWQNGIFDDEPAPPQNGRTTHV